jgi:hypothetical protein
MGESFLLGDISMTRLIVSAAVLFALSLGADVVPAQAQTAREKSKQAKTGPSTETAAIFRMLKTPIKTKDLQQTVKLKMALDYIREQFDGKLVIHMDRDAFVSALGADAPDPFEEEVVLPGVADKIPAEAALRALIGQVGKRRATFLVRNGQILIVPELFSTSAAIMYDPIIAAAYERRPLTEILLELSDRTGLPIDLDPSVGAKAATPITVTFRNCSLEDALTPITEMARLKYVVLQRSIYVTTPGHARTMENEEAIRRKLRESAPLSK